MRHDIQDTLPIHANPLSYVERLDARDPTTIDLVVIHCTELPDLGNAREYGERICHADSKTGNSGHFYIDRDGRIEEWVATGRIAHHVRGFNPRSVGIELVNRGRWPDWLHSERQEMSEPYTEAQIRALTRLLDWLSARLPGLQWIAGHEQLDQDTVPASDGGGREVRRKRDPGPLFPWPEVLAATRLEQLPA